MVMDTRVNTYPKGVATIFVFNLIFGSGALLLPYAFAHVGYVIGTILFLWLAFLSFVTCTYVVESMSLACAIASFTNEGTMDSDNQLQVNETHLLVKPDERIKLNEFEVGNDYTLRLLSTFSFLYERMISCSKFKQNMSCHGGNNTVGGRFCEQINEINVFRIYITIFTVLIGSLIFFNVSKTKLVQFSTICIRWLAFILMISLAMVKIAKGKAVTPDAVNLKGIPLFIGTGLYSFMCQHSLPSLLFPIRDTTRSYTSLFIYAINAVLVIYLLVTYSAVFAFEKDKIKKIYTMNFIDYGEGIIFQIIGVFLQLFPVFALSSSYPIVGITLRENIKALLFNDNTVNTKSKFILKQVVVPILVVYPPYVAILFLSNSVDAIVSVVGSYAGTLVQYVIPSLLVLYGQRKAKSIFGASIYCKNFQKSPFGHIAIISLVLTWSILGVCIVTYCNVQKLRRFD